ncbi:MAG: hypothetical protein ACRDKT_01965, partial [Actinomycetota bacterium]
MNKKRSIRRSGFGRTLRWALAVTVMLSSFVVGTGTALAADCSYVGPSAGGPWDFPGNWNCGVVPGNGDTASIGAADNVIVDADASVGSLFVGDGGVVTLSDEATLAAGTFSALSGAVGGTGTLTVAGTFTKDVSTPGGLDLFEVRDSADLVLNGSSSHLAGEMCVATLNGPDNSTMTINNTYTIGPDTGINPFACSEINAAIHIGPDGHLIKTGATQKNSQTPIDNDGTITVQEGTFFLLGGSNNAGGATSDGAYLADEGAFLELQGGSPPLMGATSRFGGEGTVSVSANVDMAAGATLDPQIFRLTGSLRLRGTDPVDLPVFELTGGTLTSDRPVTAHTMNVTSGFLQNDFSVTVPAGGSFSKTGAGSLTLRNNDSAGGSPDLVLDADGTLDGGSITLTGNLFQSPDEPNLHINETFTIGAGAASVAFDGALVSPVIHVNGPDGHLLKSGTGTTTTFSAIDNAGGTVTIGPGQTLAGQFNGRLDQSGGLTEVAATGTLATPVTLTGGELRGAGQITGNLINTAGTVGPGDS